MLAGKAGDVHVNVDTESKTWPNPIGILDLTFASIVPTDPCQIAIVSRHIGEVEGHCDVRKLVCRELGVVHVTLSD